MPENIHESKILSFPTRAQAVEAAMVNYLEEIAIIHEDRPGRFLVVFRHGPSGMMAALAKDGQAVLLEDW